ncbi:MAG TPA: hypothetical protein VF308_05870 [Caldimonas sp.]|jgi:hypothetical protein
MRSIRLRALLADVLALACATAVFVASALELPVDTAVAVPAVAVSR